MPSKACLILRSAERRVSKDARPQCTNSFTRSFAGWRFPREELKLSEHGSINGAEWLARALAGAGTTHVFFVESVLRRTLLQLKDLGVAPILAHSEKAAAYMADGYARIAGRPGVCMAQAVRAANLASRLEGPFSGRRPVGAP